MGLGTTNIFTILNNSPGDLVYFLVVGASILITGGFAAANLRTTSHTKPIKHLAIGCLILLCILACSFSLRALPSQGIPVESILFPIVEYLLDALMVMWLIWLFIETDQHFLITGVNIFLSLALAMFAVLLFIHDVFQLQILSSNRMQLMNIWQGITIFIIILGIILILVARPHQWFAAIGMLFLLFAGHILQVIYPNSGTYPLGAVRLVQILAFPWLITLIQRLPIHLIGEKPQFPVPDFRNKPHQSDVKPTLVDLLLQISLKESPEERYKAIVQAISYSLISDICYLVQISKENDAINLLAGYDLIREVFLPTPVLGRDELLHIMDAWDENKVLRLSDAQPDTRDLFTLSLVLKFHRIGHLLAYPISLPDQSYRGGVIFLSPYTSKFFGEESQDLLDKIQHTLASVLFAPDHTEQLKAALKATQNKLERLMIEKDAIVQAVEQKQLEVTDREIQIDQIKAKYQVEKSDLIATIERLQQKIDDLNSKIAPEKNLTEKLEQIQTEIRQLIIERDQLRDALLRANMKIKELEDRAGQTGPIRLSIETQIISLDSVVANLKMRISPGLRAKNLDMEIINPDGRQMIKTDPELLQIILHGLLENAIQASERGSSIQLQQNLSLETGMLILQVTDHGAGLTGAEQEALFASESKAINGVGSLTALREAVRAIRVLNGKVWLKSKKGIYTTFRVQLPVRIID